VEWVYADEQRFLTVVNQNDVKQGGLAGAEIRDYRMARTRHPRIVAEA